MEVNRIEMKNYNIIFNIRLIIIGVILICMVLSGCSSKPKKYQVGILSGLEIFETTIDGFKGKMAESGYIEGKNIIYDVQKTGFDIAIYQGILKKFVNDKVDLIFVFPTEAALEAKTITNGTGIPVIFANAFTEDTSLVNNIKEPGGNITGVRWVGKDIALQRFEILQEMIPEVKRIIIMYQRYYPIVKSQLEALRPVAAKAGITLIEIPALDPQDLESQLKKMSVNRGTDAILGIAEPLLGQAWNIIDNFAKKNKLPIGAGIISEEGGNTIFNLTPQNIPQGNQAAFLTIKVFNGAQVGTLPVLSAENYFIINYKAVQKLGLRISDSLLNQANEIIR